MVARKIEIFRAHIQEPSRDELLSIHFDPGLYLDPFQTFRDYIRQIYRVETKVGSDVSSALARQKQERIREQKPVVLGKKEIDATSSLTSTVRIPSERSTISDNDDSSGGGLVVSTQENPTNMMADALILLVILNIWKGAIPLSFAPRERPISLMWQTYFTASESVSPILEASGKNTRLGSTAVVMIPDGLQPSMMVAFDSSFNLEIQIAKVTGLDKPHVLPWK